MGLTPQQQAAIDAVIEHPLVMIKAVAGAGKTFTLIELARRLNPSTGTYLAYNKAIAEEATQKFKGTTIKCSTIHSLAYSHVVRQYGLNVGWFSIRDIKPKSMAYPHKKAIVDAVESFCLSASLNPADYCARNTKLLDYQIKAVVAIVNDMASGTIACTHSFYLKLFHLELSSGRISIPEVDLLMIDEAGDLTNLTIEIFKLLKAKRKVAVGDPFQNIYSFNDTVNMFNVMSEGVHIDLTESFRVSEDIADDIEAFVGKHLDSSFEFIGRKYPADTSIETTAYIARNNSGLLSEMFRCMDDDTPFHTTRRISAILELPLILANLGNGKAITEYKYKHIEKARSDYEASKSLQTVYKSVQKYAINVLEDDTIDRAYSVMRDHGPTKLNTLVKYAKACATKPCTYTLSTAHSVKGLEFSQVEIAPDLNEKTKAAITALRRFTGTTNKVKYQEAEEELRLYYVATSRAMISLVNATQLPSAVLLN